MKSIRTFALSLALVATSVAGCAGPFDTCVRPYTSEITWTGTVTELGDVVGAFLLCDPTFSGGDAPVCALESLNQLETTLGPDGGKIVNCLVAYYETAGTAKQQASAKAVGLKRGIVPGTACTGLHLSCEGGNCARFVSGALGALASSGVTAHRGERPTAARGMTLNSCDRACGKPLTGLVTPSGCSCWRESKTDWRASRWVPLSIPVERGGTATIQVDAATGMSGALPIGLTDYNDVACADFSYKRGTNELLSVLRYYCESI